MSGSVGAHLVSWAQTRIDSRRPGPVADLRPGALWEWRGRPIPLPSMSDDDDPAISRAILGILPATRFRDGLRGELPLLDRRVTLVHRTQIYEATLVEITDLARPVILFRHALPPEGEPLRVAAPGWLDATAPGALAADMPAAPLTATRIRV
jgi:hypothetical protein